jgi:DNA repair photolyase
MKRLPMVNPESKLETVHLTYDEGEAPNADVKILADQSRAIVSRNASPDLGFEFSVNPYRGCMHACAYCYARPSHEYLGLGAGTDFDRIIVVKHSAPELLRETFMKKSWKGDLVVFSGVTDCYQPIEKTLELTRKCLEVCLEFRNPVGIVTKSALIERDIDLLCELNAQAELHIAISLPFLCPERARALEPYAPTPERRLKVIERLVARGLEVGVSVAPIIPGLSEDDVPALLAAAREHGATRAGYSLLRLPGSVREVFESRLREALPLRADKVLNRLKEAHGGKVYRSEFGTRHRGEGPYAEQIEKLFAAMVQKVGLRSYTAATLYDRKERLTFKRPVPALGNVNKTASRRRPKPVCEAQMTLFGAGAPTVE